MNWERERDEKHGTTEYHRMVGTAFGLCIVAGDYDDFVSWAVNSRGGLVGHGEKSTVPEAMAAAKECASAALDKARVELEVTTTEVEG